MNHTGVTVARRRHDAPMGGAWNPWRELRSRPHITFVREDLPPSFGGGVCARWSDGDVVIVLDRSLDRCERNVALAHELVHDERGHFADEGMPPTWHGVVAREETIVNRIVARRLVPQDELHRFISNRLASDLTTTPHDVAEEFDTTWQLAELSMLLLKGDH